MFVSPDWPGEPVSIYFWGHSPELVHWVMRRVILEIDPAALWLEVACGSGRPPPPTSELLGEFAPDRVLLCDTVEGMAPGAGARALVLPGLIRPDERPEVLASLRSFLRLPSAVQEIISRIPEGETGRVVALSNLDRVAGLLPQHPDDLRVLLDGVRRTRVSLTAAFVGTPPPHRVAFDTVIEVRAPERAVEGGAELVWEKVGPSSTILAGERRPFALRSPAARSSE
jgi:hypothetical protein